MGTLLNIGALCLAYLLGSIPSAVWIGKRFYGVDVREYGSGNAGATNTFRVLGKRAGIPVLILDCLKGWLAVNIPYLSEYNPHSEQFVNFQLALGVAAIFGHIFPLFAGFRGGKGIATLLGIVIALHYQASLVSIVVFLIVFMTFRYVSLGSMVAAIMFPISIILIFKTTISSLVIFSLVIAALVLITHQKNIERLLKREESRVNLFKRKGPPENEPDDDD